MNPYFITYYL